MKQTGYFDKLIAGGIMLMTAFSLCAALTGCRGDNRNGEPYKLRVELTTLKPDEFNLGWVVGSYEYIDETGLKQSVSFQPDDLTIVQSACIREIEIPRNFDSFLCATNVPAIEILNADKQEDMIYGKVYVDEKLLVDFASHHFWIISVSYDKKSRQYAVLTSNGVEHKTFETKTL